MSYSKYQHIERLGTTEVKGITNGTCYIFPKLDGTNSKLWWENGLKAGSRNKELTLTSDNAGFYNWAVSQSMFEKFFTDFPDLEIYGEWLVPHTIKHYEDSAWKRFYVFDVLKDGKYLPFMEYVKLLSGYGIDYIPLLAKLENPSDEELLALLSTNTFMCQEGSVGEGVVIKNYDYINQYGRVTWAKIVSSEVKTKHDNKAKVTREIEGVEYEIVDKFFTEAFIQKEYAKLINDVEFNSKLIPRLLTTVWHEFIVEESWNILKHFKNPTIDFKKLNQLCIAKTKQTLTNIF